MLNIFFSTVGLNFDQRSNTDTCKQLMKDLIAEDLNCFITHCYSSFLQPLEYSSNGTKVVEDREEEEEGEGEEEEEGEGKENIPTQRRLWALENIAHLIMNNSSFDPLLLIDFLYPICCLSFPEEEEESQRKDLPSSLSFIKSQFVQEMEFAYPAIDEAVREKAHSILTSTINSLAVLRNGKLTIQICLWHRG